ncbi:hypothetical protein [Polyangium jinanense]|uniref:Energy transducer TonB n=1 Tax=Polyangium jinanense TaxID=2829994 RepID=A0A9X3XDK6_9BACT|nr:hypothetical protein [Polyangium jinanense]MDC3960955.1 hypothetical protein [Polyangium jinanense]MDC3987375.1 hypothetical protein [Polyangium jinanense]
MPLDARLPLAALFVACTACNGAPPAPASPPPAVPIATAMALAEPPAPSAEAPASSVPPPAEPPPYPEAWIREAETTNQSLSCLEVIYKQGCSSTRVGSVTVAVTLAPDGKVMRLDQVDNTVENEPEVVWRCLVRKLPMWKLHAPEGTSPTFRLTLHFHDKC